MLSVVNIRAQISSVIDALSKAAVAEIAKVVEDGMVVLRMEICQRDNEILKLKGSIDILNHELKAASGGQDRGSGLHTGDDQQGSDGKADIPPPFIPQDRLLQVILMPTRHIDLCDFNYNCR
ncbi:hypothetical protein N1851_009589 [Merluccius polli]|uniref:Uncharacterized protein n=1 Tax=Merluccius polli TaxID=89951 RepID=A0AA47MZT8_MERPO|nr:hypothetical protein N1851_009589 [Merluccius polli]